jgi:hypothetical protein
LRTCAKSAQEFVGIFIQIVGYQRACLKKKFSEKLRNLPLSFLPREACPNGIIRAEIYTPGNARIDFSLRSQSLRSCLPAGRQNDSTQQHEKSRSFP